MLTVAVAVLVSLLVADPVPFTEAVAVALAVTETVA